MHVHVHRCCAAFAPACGSCVQRGRLLSCCLARVCMCVAAAPYLVWVMASLGEGGRLPSRYLAAAWRALVRMADAHELLLAVWIWVTIHDTIYAWHVTGSSRECEVWAQDECL